MVLWINCVVGVYVRGDWMVRRVRNGAVRLWCSVRIWLRNGVRTWGCRRYGELRGCRGCGVWLVMWGCGLVLRDMGDDERLWGCGEMR